jgi:hypothetical protein
MYKKKRASRNGLNRTWGDETKLHQHSIVIESNKIALPGRQTTSIVPRRRSLLRQMYYREI